MGGSIVWCMCDRPNQRLSIREELRGKSILSSFPQNQKIKTILPIHWKKYLASGPCFSTICTKNSTKSLFRPKVNLGSPTPKSSPTKFTATAPPRRRRATHTRCPKGLNQTRGRRGGAGARWRRRWGGSDPLSTTRRRGRRAWSSPIAHLSLPPVLIFSAVLLSFSDVCAAPHWYD